MKCHEMYEAPCSYKAPAYNAFDDWRLHKSTASKTEKRRKESQEAADQLCKCSMKNSCRGGAPTAAPTAPTMSPTQTASTECCVCPSGEGFDAVMGPDLEFRCPGAADYPINCGSVVHLKSYEGGISCSSILPKSKGGDMDLNWLKSAVKPELAEARSEMKTHAGSLRGNEVKHHGITSTTEKQKLEHDMVMQLHPV
jgi:hypothetical protein